MIKRAGCLCAVLLLLLSLCPALAEGPELSGCELTENGYVCVTWDDPGQNGPYRLIYSTAVSDDPDSPEQKMRSRWVAESGITGRSCTFIDCIPGVSYWFELEDSLGNTALKRMTAGEKIKIREFATTRLYAKCRSQENGKLRSEDGFSAAVLSAPSSDSPEYGLYLRFTHDQISRATDYVGLLAVTDPNGVPMTVDIDIWPVARNSTETACEFCDLSWYWNTLIKEYGSVPKGTYTAELYLNGFYAAGGSFTVNP